MRVLHLDVESRSACDLTKHNAYVYFDDPTTDLWLAAWSFDNDEPEVWWPGEPCPAPIVEHVRSGGPIAAWNAAFERLAWNKILGPRYGWPVPTLEQFRCVMVEAYAMALPGKLEKAAVALGLEERKDQSGKLIMLQMSKPRRPRKGEPDGLYWVTDREKLAKLAEYCLQDVRTEVACYNRLLRLRDDELALYHLDARMNDLGVHIDEALCHAALSVVEQATKKLDAKIREATDWAVRGISNTGELTAWIRKLGLDAESVAKDALADLLMRDDLPPNVREALYLRQEGAKVSTAKIPKMLGNRQCDGRMRGNIQFHGAATGRDAARGAQLQNLPRPAIKVTESVIADVMRGSAAYLDMVYGEVFPPEANTPPTNAMSIVSDCIRGMITAAPGHRLMAVDYSQIEARVIAWLAGQEDVLDAFRRFDRGEGPDIYSTEATKIYRDTIKKDDPRRQVGKVAVLSLGFEGGPSALLKMARNYRLDIGKALGPVWDAADEEKRERATASWKTRGEASGAAQAAWIAGDLIKQLWRSANPRTVALWKDVNEGAIEAASNPGRVVRVGRLAFRVAGSWLTMRLPSGRVLFYAYPKVVQRKMPWTDRDGDDVFKPVVTFWAENSVTKAWAVQDFYGGFGAQNATQAVARDIMKHGMRRAEAAGYPPILPVHDEVIVEVPEKFGSFDEFKALMLDPPEWADGLPVAGDGFVARRYRK